jgi:hypothetical protein
MQNDFAVFILTHGRPDNIKTLRTLEAGNYTGKIYIIIDNEDDTADQYYEKYGDKVIMFDKLAISQTFDEGDNFTDRRTIVYARNACFDIAKELGLTHFLELDDDYSSFMFRAVRNDKFIGITCLQLDRLFTDMLAFLESSGALTVTFAQGGDFIGGKDSDTLRKGLLRKAMNTFFCRTDTPINFVGRINEDVNTYVTLGSRGDLLFTVTNACIVQISTQTNAGGMTDIYLDSGTYIKSFYTVMMNPSCVTICKMGSSHLRLHHRISWNNCVPKILNEKHRRC